MNPALATALLVMLDPGHQPDAPGAISARGRAEHLFNEEMARLVASALEARGLRAGMTRKDAEGLSLASRASRAKADGAALLLSLHHDSVNPKDLGAWDDAGTRRAESSAGHGFSLHVRGDSAESVRIAKSIGQALVDGGFKPTAYHLDYFPVLDAATGVYDRRQLGLLNNAKVPAVILEFGFIVNRLEEEQLSRPEVREALSQAVAQGVVSALKGGGR